jgi:hypothetical protein
MSCFYTIAKPLAHPLSKILMDLGTEISLETLGLAHSAHVVEDTFRVLTPVARILEGLACGDWAHTLDLYGKIDIKATLARANDEKTYL